MPKAKKITLPVLDLAGNEVEKVELSVDVFGAEINKQAMFDAVQVYQANMRQATAKTKKRSEVSGGGKKPWRQKGTGRARAGSTRSPLWRHGGIVFGPTGVQNFKLAMNRKVHKLALTSALSTKVEAKGVIVVKDFTLEAAKTKEMVKVCTAIHAAPKSLIVIAEENDTLVKAARNIPGLIVVKANNVSVYDVLNTTNIIFALDAVKQIEEVLK